MRGWKTSGRKSMSNPESDLWLNHLERSAAQGCCLSSVRWQTSSHFTWLQTKDTERFVQENSIISSMKWKSERESQNRWGWRTLLEIARSNSYCRCDKSRLLRAISAWGLDIPRYWDFAKSQYHLFQCLINFRRKKCFSHVLMWFALFQFVLILSLRRVWPFFSSLSLQAFMHIDKTSLEPSLLQGRHSALLSSACMTDTLTPSPSSWPLAGCAPVHVSCTREPSTGLGTAEVPH